MAGVGERRNDTVHPSFDRSISIDLKGAKTGLIGIALVCFDGAYRMIYRLCTLQELLGVAFDSERLFGICLWSSLHVIPIQESWFVAAENPERQKNQSTQDLIGKRAKT